MRINQIDRIETVRGGNPFGTSFANGDLLDSIMNFYSGPRLIDTADKVNTDPSLNWKGRGGIMAECSCHFIFDRRQDNGKEVLFLFQASYGRLQSIVKAQDLTEIERTFVSLIPNPAHSNKYIMTNLLVHDTAINSDGSQGCTSVKDWTKKYSGLFQLGDKGIYILSRDPAWQQPDTYRLPGGHV